MTPRTLFHALLAALLFSAATLPVAAEEHLHPHEMPMVKPPAVFQELTAMVGAWEGVETLPNGKEQTVVVEYTLTAAGTALVEKFWPGGEHEMISVYHGKGDGVQMTHYCALGNQPRLELTPGGEPGVYTFDFQGGENLSVADDPHMHGVTITLSDDDHMTHSWQYYVGGKLADTKVIRFTRKK